MIIVIPCRPSDQLKAEPKTSGYNVPSALYDPNMRIAVHAWRDFYARGKEMFSRYMQISTVELRTTIQISSTIIVMLMSYICPPLYQFVLGS